jgi:hypothetical protein
MKLSAFCANSDITPVERFIALDQDWEWRANDVDFASLSQQIGPITIPIKSKKMT